MNEKRRLVALIAVMITVSALIGGVSSYRFYRTAVRQKMRLLNEGVANISRLIEAVAAFDRNTFKNIEKASRATLSQVFDAFTRMADVDKSTEIMFFKKVDANIEIFLRFRNKRLEKTVIIPMQSERSIITRLAFQNKTGSGNFIDYRGKQVLAAYSHINALNTGVIMKIDFIDMMLPYLYSSSITLLISIIIMSIAAFLFVKISNPVFQKIEDQERVYKMIISTAQDCILTIDEDCLIRFVNPATEVLFDRSLAELSGRDISILMNLEDSPTSSFLESLRYERNKTYKAVELMAKSMTGRVFPVEVSASRQDSSRKKTTTLFLHDLTLRKKNEMTIRRLTHRLLEVNDQKQDFISKELHDNIGASLILLKLETQTLLKDKKQTAQQLSLLRSFDEAVEFTRALSISLSPVAIRKLGFALSVKKYIERIRTSFSGKVTLQLPAKDITLPTKTSFHLYRMVQECLNNAVKHSEAKRIALIVNQVKQKITIKILDNGIGSSPKADNQGLGLSILQQRAEIIGAKLKILSKIKKGTGVTIELNVKEG